MGGDAERDACFVTPVIPPSAEPSLHAETSVSRTVTKHLDERTGAIMSADAGLEWVTDPVRRGATNAAVSHRHERGASTFTESGRATSQVFILGLALPCLPANGSEPIVQRRDHIDETASRSACKECPGVGWRV